MSAFARLARSFRLTSPFRRAATADLKRGLTQREFVVHYQPKVEITGGQVMGVEALVRWNHPQRGLILPAEFLPTAAEAPSLLAELTAQVLETALNDCASWRDRGLELSLAVNIATEVLLERPLIGLVEGALRANRIAPSWLTLELTEGALSEREAEVTRTLKGLRGLGVSLSIDDFGTGHSSLARVRALPLNELKVDRSFIAGIANDTRDIGIARHVIELGLELGMQVVAEGVEDKPTLEVLRSLGCTMAQGFYISPPLAEDQLRRWLASQPLGPLPPSSRDSPS